MKRIVARLYLFLAVDSSLLLITFTRTVKKLEGSSVTQKFTIAILTPYAQSSLSLPVPSSFHLLLTAFVLNKPSSSPPRLNRLKLPPPALPTAPPPPFGV